MEGHTGNVPMRVALSDEDVKTIEENDYGEIGKGEPGSEWLETTLEDQCVAVDTLSLERLVELDVRNANRAPSKERGDSSQFLEPSERS